MGLAVKQLKNRSIFRVLGAFFVSWVVPVWSCLAQPIYHETHYPDVDGPFPAVIALHTSGGFKTVKHLIQRYVDDGFVVYAPDFFYAAWPWAKQPHGNIFDLSIGNQNGTGRDC